MKGWQFIGRVKRVTDDGDLVLMHPVEIGANGDILNVSAWADGRMFRCGSLRARSVGEDLIVCDCPARFAIPGIAEGDYIFRARAIGEDAFSPRRAAR
jgi:hypothetical protein